MPRHDPERIKAFDTIVNSSTELLNNVGVRRRLGREQTEMLRSLVRHAFLPNIYHNRVELPREHYSSDHVPVIPLLRADQEQGLFLNGSMYVPTQSRFDKIHAELQARYGFSRAEARRRVLDAATEFTDVVDPKLHNMSTRLKARSSAAMGDVEQGVLLTPRPHVVFGIGRTEQSATGTGAAFVHELRHVADAEELLSMPASVEDWFVYSELKAGNVTHACLEGAGVIVDETIVDPAVVHGEGFASTLAIERMRRQLNPADNPYQRHPALVNAVRDTQLMNLAIKEQG